MPLTLNQIPGFADVPNGAMLADTPAFALYLNRINANAAFGMVRMEVFQALYHHGDTVILPTSKVDGYNYSREELIYVWGVQSSLNPDTGWISGPLTLWYCNWFVQQWNPDDGADNTDAGKVSSIEWYATGDIDKSQESNDGTLIVFTIAQRQKTTMLMAAESPGFTDLGDAAFAVDKPLTQTLIQTLNDNAKFASVNSECFYLGEYVDGDTVDTSLLVSPVDGHIYSASDAIFLLSWRWTTTEDAFVPPSRGLGLFDHFIAAIDGSGNVSIQVAYKGGGHHPLFATGHGRIAAFAICTRSFSLSESGDAFAEINQDIFMPGETLRASNLSQLNKNTREAICSPEFFGPTNYTGGDTVPLPTSPIDGYIYTRDELICMWEWAQTIPKTTGQYYRQPAFTANIGVTGVVSMTVWRYLPGGPYVTEPAGDSDDEIRVLVVGLRGRQTAELTGHTEPSQPTDADSLVNDPYVISFFTGDGVIPTASQVLLSIRIAGSNIIGGGKLPQFLTGSSGDCIAAPTADWSLDIEQNGVSVGSMDIAAGQNQATFSFSLTSQILPYDKFDFIAPSTADTTIAGISCTLSGVRYATDSGGDFS